MPILRPLVGMDKEEIVAEAVGSGPSDLDHPRSGLLPALHAAPSRDTRAAAPCRAAEQGLPIDEMVARGGSGAAVEDFRSPVLTEMTRRASKKCR